ncbi:MAG: ABC transporter permease [Chloroflexota bacterium]
MAVARLSADGSQTNALARKPRSLWSDSLQRLYKNKIAMAGAIFITLVILASIFAPFITTGDFARQDLMLNSAVPEWLLFLLPAGAENYANITSEALPFGFDDLGRDLWTRSVYGARISLQIAFVGAFVSFVVGVVYGLVSGYLGGRVDGFMMRFVDFLYGFPFLIVVILMQTYFKALGRRGAEGGIGEWVVDINNSMGGLFFLFIAIGLINWLGMARVTRGQVLSVRQKEYVEAAKAVGSPDMRIIFRHIFPNILGPLIVFESLAIPGYIFTEAFLSFIGLGVDAPTPSWGIMISELAPAIRSYPNQVLIPAVALSLTTLAFNFLGDGLRDAFDPRQKE